MPHTTHARTNKRIACWRALEWECTKNTRARVRAWDQSLCTYLTPRPIATTSSMLPLLAEFRLRDMKCRGAAASCWRIVSTPDTSTVVVEVSESLVLLELLSPLSQLSPLSESESLLMPVSIKADSGTEAPPSSSLAK